MNMENEELVIGFETAKLAMLNGFPQNTRIGHYAYNRVGKLGSSIQSDSIYDLYAPTQSLLQRWLREEHNIHVYAYPVLLMKNNVEIECDSFDYMYMLINKGITEFVPASNEYTKHEEALEDGLFNALTLIKI